MRIVFIGCVESSKVFLEETLSVKGADVVGIVTRAHSAINSDFVSLSDMAEKYGIPCFFQEQHSDDEMISWLKKCDVDIIYCFGWSFLLKNDVLCLPRLGALGYHPALLPANRGRHPIIWALALGLSETGSTFFFLNETADSGDIISQEKVTITDNDTAKTLYDKLLTIGKKQVNEFTKALIVGNYKRIRQDENKSNEWRKRTVKDGIIDWRMPARGIYNLVRALTHPYVGASFYHNGNEIKVWKADIIAEHTEIKNIEPGRILSVENGIEVQSGCGIIRLLEYDAFEVKKGDCL